MTVAVYDWELSPHTPPQDWWLGTNWQYKHNTQRYSLVQKNVVKVFNWRPNTLRYLAICICQPSGTQSQGVEVGAWGWVAT